MSLRFSLLSLRSFLFILALVVVNAQHLRLQNDNTAIVASDANKQLAEVKFIGVPTTRAEVFVGGDCLSEIHRHFSTRTSPTNGRTFVLRGRIGMGKTEIALQYATTYAGAYSRVVWIHAASEQEILQSFKAVAERLGAEDSSLLAAHDSQTDVDLALATLSQANQNVLLIYDGLDDVNLSRRIIDQHRPKWGGSMSIIITTSYNIPLILEDRILTLRGLEPRDGNHLLHKLLEPEFEGEDDDKFLDELGQAVGWSPLALRFIASLLKMQQYPLRILLDTLKYSPMLLLEQGNPSTQGYHVIRILKKSIDRFRRDASTYTNKFLSLKSFLCTEVPYTLIEQGHKSYLTDKASQTGHHGQVLEWLFGNGSWTSTEMHMELSELIAHNIVWHEGGSWKQQPLMGEVIRHSSAHPEESIMGAAYLIHAVAEEIRKQHGVDATPDMLSVYHDQLHIAHLADTMIEFCHRVLKKNIATIVPLQHIENIANWKIHAAQYQLAIGMLKAGIEQQLARGISIADARVVRKARQTLALALRRDIQLQEAESEQEIVIQELEDILSHDRNNTSIELELIAVRGGLTSIWRDRGRYEDRSYFGKSIRLGKQIVQEVTQKLGEAHLRTLHEMSRVATTYRWAGRAKKSLELNKKIHGLCVSNLPLYPSRQQRLKCLRKLQHVRKTHFISGEFTEAVTVGKEVMKQMRELQGDRHMETAEALYNLAISCYKAASVQGRGDALLQLVTSGRCWIALRELVKAGSFAHVHLNVALEYIQEAIDIWKELLGEDHEKTRRASEQKREIVLALAKRRGGVMEQVSRNLWSI